MVEYLGSWSKKAEVLLGDPQMPGSEVLALSAAGFLSRTLPWLAWVRKPVCAPPTGWGGVGALRPGLASASLAF